MNSGISEAHASNRPRTAAPVRRNWLTNVLLISTLIYIGIVAYFAVSLLNQASTSTLVSGSFLALAVGPVIQLCGTLLTVFAAVHTAYQQSATAREVEGLRLVAGRELEELKSERARELAEKVETMRLEFNKQLEEIKTQSAQQLERLKNQLDVEKAAYRELCGAAAIYYYTLRSSAIQNWDDELLKQAEAGMVHAAKYLIYVSEEMITVWTTFWQEAQHIYRGATQVEVVSDRQEWLQQEMVKPVPDGRWTLDLRDRHAAVEDIARRVIKDRLEP